MKKIVLATGNRHKAAEITAIIGRAGPARLLCLDDFPPLPEPVENGATFAENARIKALFYARRLGEAVLAEDSGLAVRALAGRPGVLSARFAGPAKDDRANIRRLLAELGDRPAAARGAVFVSVVCLARPGGDADFFAGYCRGRITAAPRGAGGFGYDPVFQPAGGDGRTFAEMTPAEKNRLSHRRRALEKARAALAGPAGPVTPAGENAPGDRRAERRP